MAGAASYDVVVVGAGAAGSVVAARLAGGGDCSVLLLEAGPDVRKAIPEGLRDGWALDRDFYWRIDSEPDEAVGTQMVPRCRLVGGTSWMTRFAVRGSPADFEEWAGLGNPGWGFDDVLPYLESLEDDHDFADQPWHGSGGRIPIDRYLGIERSPVHRASIRAIEAIGIPAVDDHNRPGAVGIGPMPMSSRNGVRVSVADAYLSVEGQPSNLTITPDVLVDRVVIERGLATGVKLLDGTEIRAEWVVVSSGVFGSPGLLMRSGIGPASHLLEHGITPFVDLPGVGERLGDHPGTDVDCGYRGEGRPNPVLHSIGTFHSRNTVATAPPDLMLWVTDPGDEPEFFIDAVLLKPEARGSVRLRSPDPTDAPVVRLPAWRQNGFDLERLVEGYEVALEVSHHRELRDHCDGGPRPGRSRQELRDEVRQNSWSVPHFVGTCSMGPDPAEGGVVDDMGKVHGVDRLSVIDASIIPIVPSGFTHLPTIMLAERLAENLDSIL
ncbi:MAG: GMC family oxidoreductase [Acidimicrobiia bacterium]